MAQIYPLGRNQRRMLIPSHRVSNFFGLNTLLSDIYAMPDGYSPDALNWMTGDERDCIILRRGTSLLGKTRAGAGSVTGLGIGTTANGTQIPFFSTGRKIKYYDASDDDTHEVGSDIIPTAAVDDVFSIFPYQNLAGDFVYVTSPNSSIYKLIAANLGSYVDQQIVDFKGYMRFGQSRSILFNRKGSNGFTDRAGLYMSYLDKISAADYVQYVGEAVGALGSMTYNYTLSQMNGLVTVPTANVDTAGDKMTSTYHTYSTGLQVVYHANGGTVLGGLTDGATYFIINPTTYTFQLSLTSGGGAIDLTGTGNNAQTFTLLYPRRTVFLPLISATVVAGTETFIDDRNGNLLSNFGGTGTINYATGVISVTFSAVTNGPVTASYYLEDATVGGVCDFSVDNSGTGGTRVAGSGRYFSQFDGGGPLNAVHPLADVFYSFHTLKTWQTRIPTDDNDTSTSAASNLPFREKMGVSYPFSAFGGITGIYYVNNANPNRPEVYVLRLYTGATSANIAAPTLLSKQLNLSQFVFDKAVVFEWGNYVIVSFQQVRNGAVDDFNSRMLFYNKKTGTWDLTDYPASCLTEYMGTLISGDPLSGNVFTLLSGFDDDASLIPNYWTSGFSDLNFPGVKKTRRFTVGGLIQKSQQIKVSFSIDGGSFVDIFTIDGSGSYVDSGKTIAVGSYVMGSKIAGGGSTVYANPFEVEFPLETDRYVYIRVRFEAIGGGYAQINFYDYKWSVIKGFRITPQRQPEG